MDSITQFALGATIGVATLSRKIGARKAAVTGGLIATLPDLDVLIRFDDPVDQFILHRGPTHSLFVQTLATPLIGEVLLRIVPRLKDARWLTWATVWLCLVTHALIDAMTVYGTRLFWPIWPEPVGVGSVFIIDPLYTLPLLVVVIWALAAGGASPRLMRVTNGALAFSTMYLAWSIAAQTMAISRGEQALQQAGLAHDRIMATPTPFNTLFWRVIAVNGGDYYNVYVPLLGGQKAATVYRHDRGKISARCLTENGSVQKLASFADGFFRLDREDGALVVSDLRMGLTPGYVFRFAVAPAETPGPEDTSVSAASTASEPGDFPKQIRPDRDYESDLAWLKAGIAGERTVRPTEARSEIANSESPQDLAPTAEC